MFASFFYLLYIYGINLLNIYNMKKITYLLLLASSMAFAQFPLPYCGPLTFTNGVEPITLVNFAGINNATDATVGAVNPAHENFTAIIGNVTAGQSYPITLKGNTDGAYNTNLTVFIDWNQNNVFTDAGERYDIGNIFGSTGLDAVVLNGNIVVPGTALGGNTRMRVVKKYNASTSLYPDSCNTGGTGFGQAEDYTLTVTSVAACLTGVNYPTTLTTPATCDGFTSNPIASDSWAGDYFYVAVTNGQTYKFTSSVASDYFTLSTNDGVSAVFSGVQPLTWISNFTGNLRVHLNTNSSCGTEDVDRVTNVICGTTCLNGGLYPTATFTPATCDGATVNEVANDSWAGEYSNIQVYASNSYVFASSVGTDYLTVSNESGTTVLAVGTGTVNFIPTTDGIVRLYFHSNTACGSESVNRVKSVVCSSSVALPGCVSNPMPMDMDVNVPIGPITATWDVPTTGGAPTSYDLYAGDSPTTLDFVGNYTTNSTGNDLTLNDYGATIYWQVVPRNGTGAATGCPIWSFTTEFPIGFCLNSPNGQYPSSDFTPTTCDGLTDNVIATDAYTGEYSVVNVISGESYVFKSGTTDFITISTDDGATAEVYGLTPLSWVSNVTGQIRFYSNNDDQCTYESVSRVRSVICGTPSADLPDYANLQFPGAATITQGNSVTVYGQVYEGGLTDVAPNIVGQAPGINAWIAVSATDTNPNTWTNWMPMTWNSGHVSNNDEYQMSIGSSLAPGTYYYATRYNLNGGNYVYGGYSASGGNFWDGTTYVSGVLTIDPPVAPANDLCSGAIALTPGGTFDTNPLNGTILAATTTAGITPSCQSNFGYDVWYSVVVPASGSLTIETKEAAANSMTDSVVSVFTGSCGLLTQIDCDDDDGDGNMSIISLNGLTPGETLYIAVWKWNTTASNGTNSAFRISAYDASLSTGSFDASNFSYYPNPVKNVLNLSYNQNITKVEVFNMLGQKMTSNVYDATSAQINMSGYTTGVYLINITSNNATKTVRVIKD